MPVNVRLLPARLSRLRCGQQRSVRQETARQRIIYFMKHLKYISAIGMVVLAGLAARAGVTVTVGHNVRDEASPEFKFKNVPSPSSNDAGSLAKFVVVEGEREPNGGGVDKLHDGEAPEDEDKTAENFFFKAGTSGGRVVID